MYKESPFQQERCEERCEYFHVNQGVRINVSPKLPIPPVAAEAPLPQSSIWIKGVLANPVVGWESTHGKKWRNKNKQIKFLWTHVFYLITSSTLAIEDCSLNLFWHSSPTHSASAQERALPTSLGGGWTIPFETYARQIGSFHQKSEWKSKTHWEKNT